MYSGACYGCSLRHKALICCSNHFYYEKPVVQCKQGVVCYTMFHAPLAVVSLQQQLAGNFCPHYFVVLDIRLLCFEHRQAPGHQGKDHKVQWCCRNDTAGWGVGTGEIRSEEKMGHQIEGGKGKDLVRARLAILVGLLLLRQVRKPCWCITYMITLCAWTRK